MRRRNLVLAAALLAFGAAPAWGDAAFESSFKTSGISGMGATEGATVKRFQGEKRSETSSMRFTGAILSRLAPGGETITITRVDKGLVWTLDPNSKTYKEGPLVPPRSKEAKAEKSAEPAKPAKRADEKPKARITKSEFTVKKTGASETINGFPCEEYVVTWLLEVEDIETKARSRSTMTTDLWTTPETAAIQKARAEESRFALAYARKIASEISDEEARQMGMAAFGSMSGAPEADVRKGLARVKNEMAKVKGYSIRTSISWTFEGEEGKSASAEKAQAPSEPGLDLSGGVSGLLGGLAGRMAQKKVEEKTAPKGGPIFTSTIEVKSINADGLPPETFEVPAGYAKKP
ncbi:MAG: hypothetical protein HY039_13605 [Nitrospirae bacterium]|nr:hypothetical protein [Nitrospirota bacterium]